MERTFIFYPQWREILQNLNGGDKFALMDAIIDYGTTGEYSNENKTAAAIMESVIIPQIDKAQKRYEDRVEYGKQVGRHKLVDDDQVKRMAKQGLSAKDISIILGVSATAVYHSEGWKSRNS